MESFCRERNANYLILTVDSALDIAGLNEGNNLHFDLIYCPPERLAHPIKSDGGEWLEIEYDCSILDLLHKMSHMRSEVNINIVTRLSQCQWMLYDG